MKKLLRYTQGMEYPKAGFAREPEVVKFSGYGRSTLWSYSKLGRFPKPRRLPGTRITVWDRRELWDWYENPEKWEREHSAETHEH